MYLVVSWQAIDGDPPHEENVVFGSFEFLLRVRHANQNGAQSNKMKEKTHFKSTDKSEIETIIGSRRRSERTAVNSS